MSRVLQRSHQQTVHCLEYNAALCEAGQKLAHKQGYDIHYCHHDVLQPLPQQYQQEGYNHIGLHACGELHMQLLTTAAATNAHSIALSPCCYHKINSTHYTALSTTGQQAQLTPSKPDLHLPQEETRTAGARIKKLRDKEQHWRLAFDCLQQHILQQTTYQPIPSTHKSLFNEDFQYFCQWAASTCHLTLPLNIDYQHFLGIGLKRLERVRKLELLRLLFKRPLELWLALDKILFLEEQGYDAQLTQFCPPDASPRNLLIMAHTLQR